MHVVNNVERIMYVMPTDSRYMSLASLPIGAVLRLDLLLSARLVLSNDAVLNEH